jgi:hypothetical protein
LIQRSPELEAMARADEPAVADRSVRRKQWLGGSILVLAGVVAAYFVFTGGRPQQRDILAGDEEFSTTSFRPPSFVRDGAAHPKPAQPELLQIPPPPPPPPAKAEEHSDTTEFNVPPPPAPAQQADHNEKGLPDYRALRSAITKRPQDLYLIAFDLLHLNGYDLRDMALKDRRAGLFAVIPPGLRIRFSEALPGIGDAAYDRACEAGLEGIVSKRLDSIYRSGPTTNWRKVKCCQGKSGMAEAASDQPGEVP